MNLRKVISELSGAYVSLEDTYTRVYTDTNRYLAATAMTFARSFVFLYLLASLFVSFIVCVNLLCVNSNFPVRYSSLFWCLRCHRSPCGIHIYYEFTHELSIKWFWFI